MSRILRDKIYTTFSWIEGSRPFNAFGCFNLISAINWFSNKSLNKTYIQLVRKQNIFEIHRIVVIKVHFCEFFVANSNEFSAKVLKILASWKSQPRRSLEHFDVYVFRLQSLLTRVTLTPFIEQKRTYCCRTLTICG